MKARLFASVAALSLALGPAVTSAQTAPTTLTLAQAQSIALENHPNVKIASLDVDTAAQMVGIAKSAYFPQVNFTGVRAFAEPGTRIASTGGLTDPTIIDRGSVGINAGELVTDFGRTDSLVEASKQALHEQEARGAATRQSVLLAVTQAYFDALRAQALVDVANRTLAQRQTLLSQITSLEQAQLRSSLDVSIAKQDMADAQQLVLEANNRELDSYATLNEALGYQEDRAFKLVDIESVPPMSENLDAALGTATSQNPDIAALTAASDAARADVTAAKRAFYPTVSVLGNIGKNPIADDAPKSSTKLPPNYETIGVVFSIPLFTGGNLESQVRAARDRAGEADLLLQERKNEIARDVHVAFDRLTSAYSNIQVSQSLVANANDALRLTEARYQIGSSSVVDLSTAQLRQTQAELSRTNSIYEYLIRRVALAYVVGTISANGSP
jgi:outer membrane protein